MAKQVYFNTDWRKSSRESSEEDSHQLEEPIYEMQDWESPRHFAYFKTYREMPADERSYTKVCEEHSRNRSHIAHLGKDNQWQKRVKAWDKHMAQISRQEREEVLHELEKTLYDNIVDVLRAGIRAAKQGNTTMQKDLLDRAGFTFEKEESIITVNGPDQNDNPEDIMNQFMKDDDE
jgi:hypothetical protein